MTRPQRKQVSYRCLIVILGCLCFCFGLVQPTLKTVTLPPACAQPSNDRTNKLKDLETTHIDDQLVSGLDLPETDQTLLREPAKIDEKLEQMSEEDIRRHPYLHFRRAMNRRPNVGKCLFSLILFGVIGLFLKRSVILQAKEICGKKFFHSFLTGFITVLLLLLLARPLFLSEIGIPLAFAFIALLELGLGFGLVVTATLIGEKIADVFLVNKMASLSEKPIFHSIVCFVFGTLLFGILLLIPGIGHLPRIGSRIVVLIATTGLGALVKSRLSRDSDEKA